MQIVGEAGIRISAITRDLRKVLQRSVNDALSGIKAPKKNALTDLQRELNQGELDLANATRKHADAQRQATAAETELTKLRKDESATTQQLTDAEEKHRHSLLSLRVAVDKVNAAQEKHAVLQERLRRGNVESERGNTRLGQSFAGLTKTLSGVTSGLGKSIATGSKLALIGAAAGGAAAGATSLLVTIGALVVALGQAAGAAGLLPAVLAGKWAVVTTAKLALTGFGDAMKAVASGDAAKLDAALEHMAPNAQHFVREINKVKPAFDRMRMDVQQRAFDGLGEAVGDLSNRYLPIADRLFGSLADTMNSMARDVIAFAFSSRALEGTNTTVNNLKSAFGTLGPAIAPAVEALLDVVSVGSTFLPQMTSSFSAGIQGISARIHEMAANGELEAFFQRALDTLHQLGRIAGGVGGIISGIAHAAETAGGGLLANLEKMTGSMSRFVNSARGQEALTGFFTAMRTIMDALMPVLQQVAVIFGTVLAPIIANVAATILPALLPLLSAFGRLLAAAAPLIEVVAEALAALFEAFAPVIDILAQAIEDALPQLLPAIQAFGEALVLLVEAAAPLIPIFVQLFAALLPILAPIVQLVTVLIPPLISLIQALMPVILASAQATVAFAPVLIGLAQVIVNVLIPPIRLLLIVVGAVIRGSIAVFMGFVNFVRGAVQAIIGFFGWLGSLPAKVGGFFARMRDAAIQRAIALVNWVKGLPGRMLSALSGLGATLFQAGINAIQGLLNGLKNAAGAVIDWIKGLAGDLVDAVLGIFGIASPSKVFHGIGLNLGRGLLQGIQSITPDVIAAAADMANKVNASARLTPAVDLGSGMVTALDPAPAGVTGAGNDGASLTAEDIAEALESVQVVVSATEITSRVNRRNASNRRR